MREIDPDFEQIKRELNTLCDLPCDVSLDFAMNKDNLFALWQMPSERLRMISGDSNLMLSWALADKDNPIKQAKEGFKLNEVIAMISLADLEDLIEQMNASASWKNLLGLDKIYFVEYNNKKYWSTKKEGDILVTGNIFDIKKLLDEGLAILDSADYFNVYDLRPIQDGHPKDWLSFMRHPKVAMQCREITLELLGHDGSK